MVFRSFVGLLTELYSYYYVWSYTSENYAEARIIWVDSEESN